MKLIVILIVALAGLYELMLNIIRYRSSNNPTPANVADVYDAETYKKWKEYSAEHCRLDIITSVISHIVTIALFATNAYSAFASLFPKNDIIINRRMSMYGKYGCAGAKTASIDCLISTTPAILMVD